MRKLFFTIAFLLPVVARAEADSPVIQGLGGAGRGGVARESLFSNPAAAAMLTNSSSFLIYEKPRIPALNAGGRYFAIGAYDGENEVAKGAAGYIRSAKARLENGQQVYEDRSEYRLSAARAWTDSVLAGVAMRYITKRVGVSESKFFQGDLGTIFPLYGSIRGGLTYENIIEKIGEAPPAVGAGLQGALGDGMQLFVDAARLTKGESKGKTSWALATELTMGGDFFLRLGRYSDAYRKLKGWSAGLSWVGPRITIDYAMKKSSGVPMERAHIFGLSVLF